MLKGTNVIDSELPLWYKIDTDKKSILIVNGTTKKYTKNRGQIDKILAIIEKHVPHSYVFIKNKRNTSKIN